MPAITFTTDGALQKSALRQANERLLLNTIRQRPSISRADIVRVTGLSPSSVTYIVKRLKQGRLVSEEKVDGGGQVGRQPTALHLRRGSRIGIGVEVTLSGARIAVGDLSDTILSRGSVPWNPDSRVFFEQVHTALRAILDPLAPGKALAVGVGLPGFIDRATGKVIAAENFGWFNVEAGALLRQSLEVPFYFENDAKLSALAEMWFAGRDATPLTDFVVINARGGLGTGVIINRQVLQGAVSAASEFGHVSLNPAGPQCPCGNVGCWELYASDLALLRMYREEPGVGPVTEPVEILARARAGEAAACRVLAGWDLLEAGAWDVLRSRIAKHYLNGLRIIPSRHGTDSALMGAVALVLSGFFHSFDHGTQSQPSNSVRIL
ncbi:MAG: ROK family transcriptional regulator [Acidobacteria bacterium]|nr:ROK family transcriptional regulator [Acidobacteriota bacterium]